MASGFKLDSTRNGNFVEIYFVAQTGYRRKIAIIEFPNDLRWRDDVEMLDEVMLSIKKRIRKSINR